MSTLSAPLTEIILRLQFSAVTDGLLDGWKVYDVPVERIDGIADLPFVAVLMPDFSEDYRSAKQALPKLNVVLWIGSNKTAGLAAHLANVDKVLNAIELNRSTPRLRNPGLSGTIMKPFNVSRGDNATLDISLTTKLTLALEARPALRGNR